MRVAAPRRPPLHVEVFNHVLTDNGKTSYERTVDLPPAAWAFGRVLLTLQIHDAGDDWDEWDRNGHLYVFDDDGNKWDFVPFITSYRTECHWEVDVTHFRPLLAGRTKFEIAAGTLLPIEGDCPSCWGGDLADTAEEYDALVAPARRRVRCARETEGYFMKPSTPVRT